MSVKIDMDSQFCCSESILSSNLVDEFVMMSIDEGKYYSLKGPSGRVWELIQGKNDVGSIVEALVSEYDVSQEQCQKELLSLLSEMHEGKLIQIAN